MFTPRDAVWLGIGALVYPLTHELTTRLMGKHVLDPNYRKEQHA